MRNEIGQPLNYASLFVHIEVQDYVPDKLTALAEALANPIAYQSAIEKRTKQLEALTDDESNREKVDNEAADVEVDAEETNLLTLAAANKGIYSLGSKDESNKENLSDKKLGDDEHENSANTAGNVTSLTKRMKSVRNFFAGGSSGTTAAQQSQSISSGLVSATSTAITANTAGQTTTIAEQQQQNTINLNPSSASVTNFVNSSGSSLASGLVASIGLAGSDAITSAAVNAIQQPGIQRQDTQTNLALSNQSKTTDVVATSNPLDISDIHSALESVEVVNQEAESLVKLREHKRVVKVQLEMDRELAALRKKHNKQLEKEISAMNQKRDKLMACQTKQRSLLAKTHSKLSRKSVSSDK